MKNYIKIITGLLLLLFFFTSCEDVIELELEDESPRLIIEANLNANRGEASVTVSLSNGFYEEAKQIFVNEAIVKLQKEDANSIELFLNQDGNYVADGLNAKAGDLYSLSVEYDGEEYFAEAIVPKEIELLSIDTTSFSPPFGDQAGKTFYQMFAEWQDISSSSEHYRVKTYQNDIYLPEGYILYNDVNDDGDLFRRPLMQLFEPLKTTTQYAIPN